MRRTLLTLAAAAVLAAPASAQTAGKSYELRTYYADPGRLDDLHARFRGHTLPLLQRHGAEVVGTWVPKPNPDHAVVALLAYPSAAERSAVWTRIVADPQWSAMKRRTDGRGLLVRAIDELPLEAAGPVDLPGKLGELELRTHPAGTDPAGALARFRSNKSPAGGLLALHPRAKTPDRVVTAGETLVSALVAVQATDAEPKVLVLAPTDYSPRK